MNSNNKMKPCPSTPNCVSTVDTDSHYIKPIEHTLSSNLAKEKIKKIVLSQKRVELVEDTENYLKFVYSSFLFRFKDDVEFLFEDNKIQMRSSSRVGYSDLGVNRKRLEKIRNEFTNTF